MEIGIRKQLMVGFDEGVSHATEALKHEGFGVLTEVDMKDTLRKKLGVEFRRYKILGACNPVLANEALGKNLAVGVLMPCNVVVYEGDDGRAVVNTVDPMQTAAALAGPDLEAFAQAVRKRLVSAVERM